MKSILKKRAIALFFAAAAITVPFSSCATIANFFKTLFETDGDRIENGVSLWREGDFDGALFTWRTIKDDNMRKRYAAYKRVPEVLSEVNAFTAAFNALMDDPLSLTALFGELSAVMAGLPPELAQGAVDKEIQSLKKSIAEALAKRLDFLLDERQYKTAVDLLDDLPSEFQSMAPIAALRNKLERERGMYASMREIAIVNLAKAEDEAKALAGRAPGIPLFKDHLSLYAEAETLLSAGVGGLEDFMATYRHIRDKELEDLAAGALKSITDIRISRDNLIRRRHDSFVWRLRETFSTIPPVKNLESMSFKDLFDFYTLTLSNIRIMFAEMKDLSVGYPHLIDPGTRKKYELLAADYAGRAERILGTLRTQQALGLPVHPAVIGLFNPDAGDLSKSRPAVFAGAAKAGASDWWWGIAETPANEFHDLVVEISDDRFTYVYDRSYKNAVPDRAASLVDRSYRTGNLWPVLNIGGRTKGGNFFVEVTGAERGPEAYRGGITVYKSFIARKR